MLFELTFPHTSPWCIAESEQIHFPFFVCELKSTQGSNLSAANQMSDSMIKALDLIAAINMEKELFVVGLCQVGFTYEVYIGNVKDGLERPMPSAQRPALRPGPGSRSRSRSNNPRRRVCCIVSYSIEI